MAGMKITLSVSGIKKKLNNKIFLKPFPDVKLYSRKIPHLFLLQKNHLSF